MPQRQSEKERSIQVMRRLLRTDPGSKIDLIMRKLIDAPPESRERYGVSGQGPCQLDIDEIAELIDHLVEAYRHKHRVVCLIFDPIVNLCANFATNVAVGNMEAIQARNRREAYEKAFDILHADGAFGCFEDFVDSGISFPLVNEGIQGVEVILRYCNDNLISVLLPCTDKSSSGTVRLGEAVVRCC